MKQFLIILLLYFTAATTVSATTESDRIAFVSMAPQGAQTVYSVAQDASGMTWVGTENGLFEYDGYSFYPCFTQGEVTNTRIHALLTKGDTLYMGTDNGLLVYSLSKGQYVETPKHDIGEVRSLCLYDGNVLCGAAKGVYRYATESRKFSRLPYRISHVYTLLKQGERILAGTINGLNEITGEGCKPIPIGQGRQPLVNAMLPCADGGTWIGTEGELYLMDAKGAMTPVNALHGNSIKSLTALRGSVFVGTDNGLYSVKNDGRATHLTHDSRDRSSIASNIVWALATDRYGNLWAGTDNGLSLSLGNDLSRTIALSSVTGNGDGNCIYDILREPDGTTWIGGSNGIIRYVPTQGSLWQGGQVAWFRQNSATLRLAHNRVRRIYRDRQGDILVCTDHGINLYDRRSGTFRNFIVTDKSGRYTTAWAYDIVQDEQNRYWISAYMGGVFMIDKQRLTASAGRTEADRHFAAGLQDIHVGRIALDRKGKLWLQLNENGLDRIDTHTLRIEHVLKKHENNISFVLTDSHGDIWTASPSMVRMFSADDSGGRVFKLQDSPARRITTMAAVGNSVWAVAGQVCMAFNADGSSNRFAVPGGLAPLALWHDGTTDTAIFGGNDAIEVLSLEQMAGKRETRLTLSAITVNGKPWQPEGSAASKASQIELESEQNNLTLKLTDMPYAGMQQCVYAYRLEGADHAWQYLRDGSFDITFNALPHGNYTLNVCEVDGEGRPAALVYTLKVRVLPPWYLTVWAKLLYAAAVIGLCLWGMNFYVMRKRLADERRARRQVMEQSEARAAFYSALSRKIKSRLAKIMAQTGDMMRNETDTHRTLSMENIRQNSAEISCLVYEALDQAAAEPQAKTNDDCCEKTDIVDFCRRAVADVRKETGTSTQELDFRTDTPIIYMALDMPGFYPPFCSFVRRSTALANGKGTVTLSLCATAVTGTVSIRLEIPSYTIPEGQIPFVFYRYNPAKEVSGRLDNINELAVLKDFADTVGGSFTVQSDEQDGTVFTLSLPCNVATDKPKALQHTTQAAPAISNKQGVTVQATSVDLTDSGLLASITAIIEAHMSDSDFNVSRLAADVGIGDKSLYRRIKQLTGKTPVELIRNIRMQRASLLLREGKFSVSEVMYLVGFQNSSYFSKCFSKTYGITPAEYSKKASL